MELVCAECSRPVYLVPGSKLWLEPLCYGCLFNPEIRLMYGYPTEDRGGDGSIS